MTRMMTAMNEAKVTQARITEAVSCGRGRCRVGPSLSRVELIYSTLLETACLTLTGVVTEVVAVVDRLVVCLHDGVLESLGNTSDLGITVHDDNSGSDGTAEHEESNEDEERLVEEAGSPRSGAVDALAVKLPLGVALWVVSKERRVH